MVLVAIKKLSQKQRDNFFNIVLYNDKVMKYNSNHAKQGGAQDA